MFKIKIEDTSIQCQESCLLSTALRQQGSHLLMPCAGKHTCGKCKIKVLSGFRNLSDMTDDEKKHLSTEEISSGIRLACFTTVFGDCQISTELSHYQVQTAFTQSRQDSKWELNHGLGFAVDIGTTTIVSYLYENNNLLSVVGEMNAQGSFGADVISRIDYSNQDRESKLHLLILEQLSSMFQENINRADKTLHPAKIHPSEVERIVITGNTTMLHFLMNYPAGEMAIYPFTPHSLFGFLEKADSLFPAYTNAKLLLPRCISAYVGADVVCSILASNIVKRPTNEINLLADIGTNGEMALYCNGRLYTCSTAAGPAFEGAGIKMGMAAKSGAITDFTVENEKYVCHTIDHAAPIGICGTGLINALSFFLQTGLVDETGAINEEAVSYAELIGCDSEGEAFLKLGDSDVILTGRDIRQLQLAKAAIHAGILTLCHECNIDPDQISNLFLCGGFGSVIHPQNAAAIGLIPKSLASKVQPLGNAAGLGASMILKYKGCMDEAAVIAKQASEISLSTSSYFMEQYIEQMMFS